MDIKKITLLALQYCIEKWGKSKYNKGFPRIRILSKKNPDNISGQYKPELNQINVYNCKNHNKTKPEICATIIHEYTHYLQCMHKYNEYLDIHKLKYDNHPYEKTAQNRELKYKNECVSYVLNNL